jgi:hypothetical protein
MPPSAGQEKGEGIIRVEHPFLIVETWAKLATVLR